MGEQKKEISRLTAVITPEHVAGYPKGIYVGSKGMVGVFSNDNYQGWGEADEKKNLSGVMEDFYEAVSPDSIIEAYLCLGRTENEGFRVARKLAYNLEKLTLVACRCGASEKEDLAKEIGASIVWSNCWAARKLGEIVKEALG